MRIPGEAALVAERTAFVETVSALTPEQFESAPTLCESWSPRDVLAHVVGTDDGLAVYARSFGRINTANAQIVAAARSTPREELLERATRWAAQPAPHIRLSAIFFLGDVSMHHSDVLRGLGRRRRATPPAVAAAILREGFVLGPHRAVRYRVVPTDGGRPIGLPGRPELRGTREVLGLWLGGRESVAAELEFAGSGLPPK